MENNMFPHQKRKTIKYNNMETKKSFRANLENKKGIFLQIGFIVALGMVVSSPIVSGQSVMPEPDKTLSPYFYILSDDPDTEQLPLKSTAAEVTIAGVIANVAITQEYKNEGKEPIEAVYVFPASARAAVYEMVMTIGERVILARIEEKDRARQQYEEAKDSGQTASLLEQERPNVFTMNVANIMPGDLVKVELKYTELLLPEERIYRFVYPTVVGPRYSGGKDDIAYAGEGWNANPYTLSGFKPLYGFDLEIKLQAGMPIKDLRCPSHKTLISYTGKSEASVSLDPGEVSGGNRDFILEYRLAGDRIETGLLLFEDDKEKFFLAMLQPPDRITPEMIPPREYVFIVDVSGSMHGFPIETSKKLLKDLIGGLKPTDRFNVILFAGASSLFSEASVTASTENIRSAISFIDKEQGGGGTELLPALKKALFLKGTEGFSRTFIIATDGYVTVEREAFELVRQNLDRANFFAFGIGSSVNRYLIEGLARAGQGEPFVVTNEADAIAAASQFRNYISSPVLTNIDISFQGIEVYDLAQNTWPDIFADRPVLIFGKYRGHPSGNILLTGKSGNEKIERRIDLAMAGASNENEALRYLWARERIAMLDDFSNNGYETMVDQHELTALGLEYNLLTRYTSFIAIDSEVRNREGNVTTVRQPLPLPDGVSNYAVGGVMTKSSPGAGKRGEAAVQANYEIAEEDSYTDEEVFTVIESMPAFPGGEDALEKFLVKNLGYPDKARSAGIQGVVFVSFTVEADGSITEIKILRGIGGGCDEEAIRVVSLMPKWKPAMQRGQAVRCTYNLPIKFSLEGK
jgi:Ca-activated chloride channel family protein